MLDLGHLDSVCNRARALPFVVVLGVLLCLPLGCSLSGDPAMAKAATYRGPKATALFAGGCFWCVQPPFDKLPGVIGTTVGFAGGKENNPSYKQVAYGRTGHTEAIKVIYDPRRVSYTRLLELFWRQIDPTDAGGQFVDRGKQYRPAIFYFDDKQRRLAQRSRDALAKSKRFDKPIVVEITKATPFYAAEAYHQHFYKKNPKRYYSYRRGSGRDQFLSKHWP